MSVDLLTIHLDYAVRLKIFEMQRWAELPPMTPEQQQDEALKLNEYIFYRGAQGQTKEAINTLVGILARLSFQPGGVDFAGLHFEVAQKAKVS